MSAKEIKVTDKRMFTPEGELKEEYRHLEEASTSAAEKVENPPVAEPPPVETPRAEPEPSFGPPGESSPHPPGWEASDQQPMSIVDLISILAEPAAIYLGDAKLPDGSSAENLDAARLHIDLIALVQEKTQGNLTGQESAILEDILYRLRLRYVQKTR